MVLFLPAMGDVEENPGPAPLAFGVFCGSSFDRVRALLDRQEVMSRRKKLQAGWLVDGMDVRTIMERFGEGDLPVEISWIERRSMSCTWALQCFGLATWCLW